MVASEYTHDEVLELTRMALADTNGVAAGACGIIRAMFPILTLRDAVSLIEQARGYKLNERTP